MEKGFTLLEIMVVIAIIGVLSSVVMFRTDLLKAQTELHSATQTIINTGKLARQRSISVTELTTGVYPSYGIYFDLDKPGKIILYANCLADDSGDGEVNESDNFGYNDDQHNTCKEEIEEKRGGTATTQSSALVEEIKLSDRIKITGIEIVRRGSSLNDSKTKASVNFLRPEPTIWLTDQTENQTVKTGYLRVDIKDLAEEVSRSIFFYTTGLIESKGQQNQ